MTIGGFTEHLQQF